MRRKVVMIAPFNTRSGYGDHARSIFYSIMDRDDLDIKCVDVKWGNTPRNHLNLEIPRHKKLLDTLSTPEDVQKLQPDVLIDIRIPNEFATGARINIGITAGVETDVVSPEFLQGMNRMDMNIVPATFVKGVLSKVQFDILNPEKRPVSVVADFTEIRNITNQFNVICFFPSLQLV